MAKEIKSMKDLWARAGVTFHLTDEEEHKLFVEFADDMQARSDVLKTVILEGRFEFDGECYSPAEAIQDHNRKYGTSLPEEDYDYFW